MKGRQRRETYPEGDEAGRDRETNRDRRQRHTETEQERPRDPAILHPMVQVVELLGHISYTPTREAWFISYIFHSRKQTPEGQPNAQTSNSS